MTEFQRAALTVHKYVLLIHNNGPHLRLPRASAIESEMRKPAGQWSHDLVLTLTVDPKNLPGLGRGVAAWSADRE